MAAGNVSEISVFGYPNGFQEAVISRKTLLTGKYMNWSLFFTKHQSCSPQVY